MSGNIIFPTWANKISLSLTFSRNYSTLFTCYSSMHLCPILELNGHCFMAKFHQKSAKWNKTNHAFKKYWQWFMYCLLNLSVNTLQRSIYQRRRVYVNKFILLYMLYKSASMDRYHRQVTSSEGHKVHWKIRLQDSKTVIAKISNSWK